MESKTITVTEGGERLDSYLAKSLDFSRSKVQKLIEDGFVTVDNKSAKAKDIVKENSLITVEIPEPKGLEVKAVDIPLDVVYQDEDVAVINKPQGLTVHQGSGTGDETLVNALCGEDIVQNSVNHN